MNKAFNKLVVGCLAFGVAVSVFAQLQPATRTQSALSTLARDTSIIQDQSQIPDQDNRVGYLSAIYNVAVHGGTGVVNLGPEIPVGTAVSRGWIHVVEAIAPATSTNSLGVATAVDVLAAGTTLNAVGLKAAAAVDAAPIVTTADNNQVTLNITGSAATNGVFLVVLELIKLQ